MFRLLVLLVVALGPVDVARGAAGQSSGKPARGGGRERLTYEGHVLPLIREYCFDCHGDGARKGEVSLDSYTNSVAVHRDRKVWEHVLTNLRTSSMPPPKKKSQPTAQERARMISWIENELFPVDCDRPDPGRVTLRRLNRVEYNNTLRDLLGVDFSPAADFPQDDVGHGFDNIGDVLSLPPVLIEKYVAAADQALDEAIVTEDVTQKRSWRFELEHLDATAPIDQRNNNWFALVREGDVHATVRLRSDGEYVIRVRAAGEQAGPEPVKMAVAWDDQVLRVIEIPERRRDAKVHELRVPGRRGTHKLAVRYLNNYVNPAEKDPRNRDRNLLLEYIEMEGPFNPPPQPMPESHQRVFFKPLKSGANPRDLAREVVERFARRAWRRPLDKAEVQRILALYDLAAGQKESFEKSVKVALQGVLVSPHFLFRGELQPEPDNPQKVHPVNEHALASRLSYFLWSSMPDDELFRLADSGKLRRNLDSQIQRMLKDPKRQALVDNFIGQWLQIRNLEIVTPDPGTFPSFTDALRKDYGTETRLFAEAIIRENRSILELLDADFSYLNERLASLYGVEGVKGEEFRRVTFADRKRGGILTQGSILTITSNPNRTSPVKRGKWVLENLLAAPPPPPPPNVPELKIDKDHPLVGTLRERMEQHRANPTCASCHDRMDGIGFAFENFDAIGAWRTQEGGAAIDASGELAPGVSFNGPAELKQILLRERRDEFVRCVVEKLMTYSLGRGLEYYDRCAVNSIVRNLEREQFRFGALVAEVVKSAPFQKRRGEGSRLPPAPPPAP